MNQIGGKKKTSKTLEQLIDNFTALDNSSIRKNLIKYINIQIIKLDKIANETKTKSNSNLLIDRNTRKLLLDEIDTLGNNWELIQSYKRKTLNSSDFIDERINNDSSLQKTYEIIKEFIQIKIEIEFLLDIDKYKKNIVLLFRNNDISNAYDEYKLELLEYLISVLKGVELESYPFNIIITGKPGLGKSFLAKEIVKLLKSTYLLPIAHLKNLKKPDVIGQYIGQTAPKTYNFLNNSIGSIIFIDEAYSIVGSNNDPFGKEFIDAMVDFMEEHKGLVSIIAAGYEDEMKKQFLDINIGLDRRFPVKLKMNELSPETIINRIHKKIPDIKTKFIDNFVNFSFNIKQEQVNMIIFSNYDGKKLISKDNNQEILEKYFIGMFNNNWTDIQLLIDSILMNMDITPESELFNVVIYNYMMNKINKKSGLKTIKCIVKDDNILIILSILDSIDTFNDEDLNLL